MHCQWHRTNDGQQRFVQVLIQPPGGPPGQYQYAPNQTFPRNMNKANATSYLIPVATMGNAVSLHCCTASACCVYKAAMRLVFQLQDCTNINVMNKHINTQLRTRPMAALPVSAHALTDNGANACRGWTPPPHTHEHAGRLPTKGHSRPC